MTLLLLLLTAADLYGDPLPDGALVRLGTVRLRSPAAFTAVCFTPDGKRLVAAEADALTVWDVATGKRLARWPLGAPEVGDVQFSRDGTALAAATNQGVLLLDPKTGDVRKRLLHPGGRADDSVERFALSPHGKHAVIGFGDGQAFRVVDTSTGAVLGGVEDLEGGRLLSVSFTPDGSHFVTSGKGGGLTLYATKTAKPVRELEPERKTARRLNIPAVGVVSTDGKEVICRTPGDQAFVVRELATAKVLRRIETSGRESYSEEATLTLFPGGRFLASTETGSTVRVWGLASGRVMREFPVAYGAFALSPDGSRLAASTGNAIQVWDVAADRPLHDGPTESPTHLGWTRDGRRVVSFAPGLTRVWDARTGLERSSHTALPLVREGPWRVGDESFHFTGFDRVLFRWTAGEREAEPVTRPARAGGPLNPLAQSRDGRWLVTRGRRDAPLRLIDLLGDKGNRELTAGRMAVFSPDSRLLATGRDRELILLDTLTARETRRLLVLSPTVEARQVPNQLSFSPDGRLIARLDVELTVVEALTGDVRLMLPREPMYQPILPAWSECGRLVAQARGDGQFVVHDAWTGAEVLRRQTAQGRFRAIAFAPDGRRVATAGADTTVIVWEVPAPPPLKKAPTRAAWDDLESPHAATGWRAMLGLIAAGDEGMNALVERLKPAAPPDAAALAKLIAGLGDPSYAVREASRLALEAAGEPARAALERAKRGDSLDARRAAEVLLARLDGDGIAPAKLRRLRAVEVLERVGGRASEAALRGLTADADEDVRAAVAASLARMAEAARSVQ